MSKKSDSITENSGLSRRNFIKIGSLALTGSALAGTNVDLGEDKETKKNISYRRLGRTGFMASDVGIGTVGLKEANVIRYAYDKGINYFDTAEGYGGGESERKIGEVMKFMQRDKIFITTKLHISEKETEESILERFEKSRKRLQTDYLDCLYMHSVKKVSRLDHKAFHSVTKKLKAEGKLRFIGVSSHGSSNKKDDSIEKVMVSAAKDGRFDVVLFVYNFLNKDAGERILESCKKHDVGTTAMKISPGYVEVGLFDADNPSESQIKEIKNHIRRGRTKEDAEKRYKNWAKGQQDEIKEYQPFFEKYNIKTNEQLREATVQWVLKNKKMNVTLVTMTDFDIVDKVSSLSGTKLSYGNAEFLKDYEKYLGSQYCRHGCDECFDACPHDVPVSKIMRYSYYYTMQGREKLAMEKYDKLENCQADNCMDCDAPCLNACPYQVNAQLQLVKAHSLLTIA